ncbi:MAG: metallophosphoesterase, partial [Planctomycetaceae bacterium]|nr:metallophosphoesterase [Planctomycetaceae bacterium]
ISRDLKPLLEAEPDYLLTGHSHQSHDFRAGATRRINPGALFRAKVFTVAVLDLATDELELREVAR